MATTMQGYERTLCLQAHLRERGVRHIRARQPVKAAAAPAPATRQRRQRQPSPAEYISSELTRQTEVLKGLSEWASSELPRYLRAPEQQWQPADLLPQPSSDAFLQQLAGLREEAQQLPNDVLVVLAGLCVVSSTLPNQLPQWCAVPLLQDVSGADEQPWARWRRSWAADRNRHRQLLCTYCYACGRINMHALENSMQTAIGAGSSSSSSSGGGSSGGGSKHPYQLLMYSMLQARMSRVMFTNLSTVAAYHGAGHFAAVSTAIATDEARHELALVSAVSQLFAADPQGAVLALAHVVQSGVILSGCRMDDGWHQSANAAAAVPLSSSGSSSSSSIVPTPAELATKPSGASTPPAAAAAAGGGNGSSSMDCSAASQLYLDFMAAADAVGVWTLNDAAAAVQQCCSNWQVSRLATIGASNSGSSSSGGGGGGSSSSSSQVAEAAQLLLRHPSMLQRLSELQLDGRLRAKRRDRARTACFSWVFQREVPLS